jgi:voltage-gated potassium channel
MKNPNRRLVGRAVLVLSVLGVATGGGTVGYMLIEGWSFVDAFYMTVITLSTVGLGEVSPLTPLGKIYTAFLIIFGVGAVLYMLAALAEFFVEGRLNALFRGERMAHRIRNLEGHVIVAGYGRFGRAVVSELVSAGRAFVILDRDSDIESELGRAGYAYVSGDASNDEDLIRCGIENAAAIVAGTPSEAENVFITLAARELNPSIRIHARSESEAGARRLKQAGADQVTAPFQMGGSRVATSILQPAVVDFLELALPIGAKAVSIEEVRIDPDSELAGMTIAEIEARSHGCRVVAIQCEEGETVPVPPTDRRVVGGDLVVALGEGEALAGLARRAEGPS